MSKTPLVTRLLAYRLFYILAVIAFILDRVTKVIIQKSLPYGTYDQASMLEVVGDFFYICHIGNTGAAWGMFHGKSFLLGIFSIFALSLFYFFRKALYLRNIQVQFALGILCGGIFGNLYDRLRYQYVVDFLDFHLSAFGWYYRWPAFNVADMSILIGVVLFSLYSMKIDSNKKNRS